MILIKKIKEGILEYWNIGILSKIRLIKKKLQKFQNPLFHLSIIPIKLDRISKNTYYKHNNQPN